jgi:Ni/Co efflux regulator RcnB
MTMTTRIACAAIAATLGVGTAAQARDWGDNERGKDHRAQRSEQRQHHRYEQRSDQRHERNDQRGSQPQARTYAHPYARPYAYSQPAPQYRAYDRVYDRAYERSYARPYERGYNHAPQPRSYSYVNSPRYWVNDWHARHLYAPPYGYQWVETDTGDVLLMALATGLIASVILSQ